MKEEFLHHVWKTKQFDHSGIETKCGKKIEIIDPGQHNFFSGPDFFNARIRIGEQIWIGNVEIHVHSSDWNLHGHQFDEAYNNVILHVVHSDDAVALKKNREVMPVFELQRRIPDRLWAQYMDLRNSKDPIACKGKWTREMRIAVTEMLSRSLVSRLEEKTAEMKRTLHQTQGDWEETLFRCLTRHMGMKTNADAFTWLGNSVPYKMIRRWRNDARRVEALLFGQAGFLKEESDEVYYHHLRIEYEHLQRMHSLIPMEHHAWKFMRMRPGNFPTIRIAQLAALLCSTEDIFNKVLHGTIDSLKEMLNAKASSFWNLHYRFDVKSKDYPKVIGDQMKDSLLINFVVPFRFLYGKEKRAERYCDSAMELLENVEAEKNSVVALYTENEWRPENAFDTQGLLGLKKDYCDRKRCLECAMGRRLLGR